MLKKLRSRKLMNSLALLFVYIRFEPDNHIHIDLLEVFRRHLRRGNDYLNLRNLIRELASLNENEYKNSIVRELKIYKFKNGKFNIKNVIISVPVFKEILDHLFVRIIEKDFDTVRTMADAVHNYPKFLTSEINSRDVWEDIYFYAKPFGEDFLTRWKTVFEQYKEGNLE